MLCHFSMRAGSRIPQHSHPAAQNGYLIRGRIRFITGEGSFEVGPGDGYLFAGQEPHGAEVLEDSEAIECFAPALRLPRELGKRLQDAGPHLPIEVGEVAGNLNLEASFLEAFTNRAGSK